MLFLNESEFSRQICPLLFSYLGIIYKEISFQNDSLFQASGIIAPFPFLPLLKVDEKWISGNLAICEYACIITNNNDLLGKNVDDVVKLKSILSLCEKLIRTLLNIANKKFLQEKKNDIIEIEIDPILQSFDHFIMGKTRFLEYLTLADFYLYMILIQLNGIYENTFRNYFWLQKFKINFDMFLAEKMAGNYLSPALKIIKTEIEHDWKMESSEILVDGKIPFEKNTHRNQSEIDFLKDINHIPESLTKSIRMATLERGALN